MSGLAIKMGHTVRDLISGFEGTVVTKVEFMTGNVQFGIQPKCEPGAKAMPDAMGIDSHMLDVVDEGLSAKAIPPAHTDIELGWKVRDRATGFEGIAVQKHTFFNGCVYFQVIPPVKKGTLINENPPMSFIEHARLEKVADGLVEKVMKATVGGPSTRVMRPS